MLTLSDVARYRFFNQHIARAKFERPDDVVAWLVAMQAQEYAMAKWGMAQRMTEITDAEIDKAFADGAILRTHLLRPTWHFVTPADIRWVLALSAPRVHAANAFMYRKLELDSVLFKRSNAVLTKSLQGGKQFTYALLEERVPQVKKMERDEALVELTKRYFTSRGPATLKDFAVWSGLTMADVKRGIEMLKPKLEHEVIDGQTYWFVESSLPAKASLTSAHLLPIYDEYVMGYKDRSAMLGALERDKFDAGSIAFDNLIVIDGMLVGSWKRTLSKREVSIETNFNARLTKAEQKAVTAGAAQFGKFLGLAPTLGQTENPTRISRQNFG